MTIIGYRDYFVLQFSASSGNGPLIFGGPVLRSFLKQNPSFGSVFFGPIHSVQWREFAVQYLDINYLRIIQISHINSLWWLGTKSWPHIDNLSFWANYISLLPFRWLYKAIKRHQSWRTERDWGLKWTENPKICGTAGSVPSQGLGTEDWTEPLPLYSSSNSLGLGREEKVLATLTRSTLAHPHASSGPVKHCGSSNRYMTRERN